MPKVRMTVAQSRCLSRLIDGATLQRDALANAYFDSRGESFAISTGDALFDKSWIEWDQHAKGFRITEAGTAAYSNATLH